jgi:hypothetical protein
MERRMQDREGSFRRFMVIALAFLTAVAIAAWGPWNTGHIPPNPGPSGTPGSTLLAEPPPAGGPSGTTGMAR